MMFDFQLSGVLKEFNNYFYEHAMDAKKTGFSARFEQVFFRIVNIFRWKS